VTIPFVKMHGAANDFVVIDHRTPFLPEGEARARLLARMCDRRRGIGADGVLLLESDPELDYAMRYHNSDGGAADWCGNGARCLARFALDRGVGRDGAVRYRTVVGVQDAHRRGDDIEVHFGFVESPGPAMLLEAAGRRFTGRHIRAGVPHFVTAVAKVADVPLANWAPELRRHPQLGPEGANVDFVEHIAPDHVAMRTHERGVEGETLACGSGAIASALWSACEGSKSPVTIRTAGGDDLVVSFRDVPGGWDVTLAGPALVAFEGRWQEGAVRSAAPAPRGAAAPR